MTAPKPDWLIALEEETARTSQARAAARIGFSAPVVSAVLKGTYAASTRRVELAVRGRLMNGKVACPALGLIPAHKCLEHQRNARKKNLANPIRVQMRRACPNCPRFEKEGPDA